MTRQTGPRGQKLAASLLWKAAKLSSWAVRCSTQRAR